MDHYHVLIVTFPAQGHINPSLRFAKRLIDMGIEVTFATSLYAQRSMAKAAAGSAATSKRLNFASFSDGYDDGFKRGKDDAVKFMTEIRNQGSKSLKDTILASAAHGRPITCLIYTLLLPWASKVARELHIPSALLWIQPATVLDVYYYYFNGFGDEIMAKSDDPTWEIQFPGVPLSFAKHDLPSFMLPSSSDRYSFALPTFKEQLDTLDAEDHKPKVLVNTFDALEAEALTAIDKYELIGVGPLIPSAFLDGGDPSDKSLSGDLFRNNDDYIEWLNSNQESSVVYVSFGSLLRLKKPQLEEIAKGLLTCNRPFLWVIRENENVNEEDDDQKLSCLEELEKLGKIVEWCSQLEVLTHPSLGCFVSHCGWNSTLESLSCGIPIVAFPQWTDQGTNAKLIEDVWKTGVRVRVGDDGTEDGIVESGEIRRCIEEVMDGGEKSRELRENVEKWKKLAREAVEKNGSSNENLKAFLEQVGDSKC